MRPGTLRPRLPAGKEGEEVVAVAHPRSRATVLNQATSGPGR
jgi:hypothetical protein